MRLINVLLALLIVAVLTVMAYKLWFPQDDEAGGGAANKSPPSKRFMRTCTEASANQRAPDRYCACLWTKGVKNIGTLFTSAKSREKAEACKAELEAATGDPPSM
jgi:hypothetical protein